MDVATRLASRLWEARRQGGVVGRHVANELESVEQAYVVQRYMESMSGMERFGWKVGATSKAAQRVLDTEDPVTAPMFLPFYFSSPGEFPIFAGQGFSVESEFAFRFSRDLPIRKHPYRMEEVLSAVDVLLPAIEIVASRFEGGFRDLGPIRLVADMVVHAGLVTGSPADDWKQVDLKLHVVKLFKNGDEVAAGIGANVLGDPINVLEWTANHLSIRGEAIGAGTIISTGTCTGIVPVEPGDEVVADFGDFGSVRLSLVEPRLKVNETS